MASSSTPGDAPEQQATFKQQLDQKAHDARHPPSGKTEEPTILDKVKEYLPPAAANLLPSSTKPDNQDAARAAESASGPPERPHHDGTIAEFVREQHRSKPDANSSIQ